MLKNRLLYLAALIGMLIFHSFYTGWFSEYLLLFGICLPVLSLLLSLPGILKLRLQMECPECVLRGESLQIRLFADDPGFFPVSRCRASVRLQNLLTGKSSLQECSFSGSLACCVILPSTHCAGLDYSVSKASAYDYLGLFRIPLRRPAAQRAFVLPVGRQPELLPDLTRFRAKAFRPKPGGGYSEIHEMREYRPGDPLREVHWKLSAKTDKLIVREPQLAENGRILLTFDLSADPGQTDSVLDALFWLSGWMCGQGIDHTVCWLDPRSLEVQSAEIRTEADLQTLLRSLLCTAVPADLPSIRTHSFPQAGLLFHVTGEEGEVSE